MFGAIKQKLRQRSHTALVFFNYLDNIFNVFLSNISYR